MKKLILLFIGVLSMSNSFSQDILDAIRYSNDEIQGTARFRSMSGAFGALGGDMSAVSINPAGAAIFNNSHASISLSSTHTNNDVSYFNGLNTSSNSGFDLNQTGASFVFNNTNSNSKWKKFVLSVSYDKTQNFDDRWFASGTNTRIAPDLSNTVAGYFLSNAQGIEQFIFTPSNAELSQYFNINESTIANNDALYYELGYQFLGEVEGFQQQQNFLGYNSFILEPEMDIDENTVYTSNIAAGEFDQEYSYAATGYNGKFAFNLATQYQDNLFLGLNLNSHIINYERSTYFFERNSNTGSTVNEVGFENNISTIGSGFSFQLGGIAKLSDNIRVGLTYNSPTWLTITEETSQYLETIRDDAGTPITTVIDPQIINIFPDYRLQTPAKVTASAALVVNKKGLISFDYSRKDHSKTKFRPKSDVYFANQNNIIANTLKAASIYKIGGEYRYKQLSFRGGYRLEESPYNDTSIMGDLNGYSLGLGYNFGNTKLDLAFDQSKRSTDYQFFNTGFTDAASIDATNTNILLSLSFNL